MRTRGEVDRALEIIDKALSQALHTRNPAAEQLAVVALALAWTMNSPAGQGFQETIDMCNRLDASFKRAEASIERARKAMEN